VPGTALETLEGLSLGGEVRGGEERGQTGLSSEG